MIRMLTGGESHNQGMLVIIDGIPAGLMISVEFIQKELKRRKEGMGRSKRMKLEEEFVEILSGVRLGRSIGSPMTLFIKNKDYRKDEFLSQNGRKPITIPRPGHADLAGMLKFGFFDIQDVLERASARETVSRVAAGAVFKLLLNEFNIKINSRVIKIGKAKNRKEMEKLIVRAKKLGDTLGGIVEVYADGVCPGLGSYTQFDKRLDGMIGMVMLSIPSVKGIEIGEAILSSMHYGSVVHDKIFYDKKCGFYRKTNNAGGIEGGMSNGERILIRLYIKPIPTLQNPLESVDIKNKKLLPAPVFRADVCAVEAIGVIAESMLAYVLAGAIVEKFGGDSIADMKRNYQAYLKRIKNV
jgi:chorismate synthase